MFPGWSFNRAIIATHLIKLNALNRSGVVHAIKQTVTALGSARCLEAVKKEPGGCESCSSSFLKKLGCPGRVADLPRGFRALWGVWSFLMSWGRDAITAASPWLFRLAWIERGMPWSLPVWILGFGSWFVGFGSGVWVYSCWRHPNQRKIIKFSVWYWKQEKQLGAGVLWPFFRIWCLKDQDAAFWTPTLIRKGPTQKFCPGSTGGWVGTRAMVIPPHPPV